MDVLDSDAAGVPGLTVVGMSRVARLAVAALAASLMALPATSPAEAGDRRIAAAPTYMAFGDSITHGIGTTDPATKAYPIQAGIGGYGIHGSSTATLLEWWPGYLDTLPQRPMTAVMLIGLADVIYGRTATETIRGLRAIKRYGRSEGIRVVFGTLTPFEEASSLRTQFDATRRAVNTWIRSRNTYVEYASALNCGTVAAEYLCSHFVGSWNDLHPNDAGAAAMATNLRSWMVSDR